MPYMLNGATSMTGMGAANGTLSESPATAVSARNESAATTVGPDAATSCADTRPASIGAR